MNKRPLKQCQEIGCTKLTRDKTGYCTDYTYIVEEKKAARNKYYDKYSRDKKYTGFYNSGEWEDWDNRMDVSNLFPANLKDWKKRSILKGKKTFLEH